MGTTAVNRTVCGFRDCRGFMAKTTFYINVLVAGDRYISALTIFGALAALSNAAPQSGSGLITFPAIAYAYGDTAEYNSVQDKAEMTFSTATGGLYRYLIPAPLVDIFLPDGETVDPNTSLVFTYTTAVIALGGCAKNGDVLTTFVGGRRLRGPKPKKLNSLTLNPALSGPGW